MTFTGLAGLSSIGKSARNGVDYTFGLLDVFLFLWRLLAYIFVASVSVYLNLLLYLFFCPRRDSYVAPLGVLWVSLLLGGCPIF